MEEFIPGAESPETETEKNDFSFTDIIVVVIMALSIGFGLGAVCEMAVWQLYKSVPVCTQTDQGEICKDVFHWESKPYKK